MDWPTYADVVAAAAVVRRHLRPTPLYEWPALSRLLGCRYFLKHENHTPTTAFKVRGGLNLVARLPDEQKRRGIIACSTGNHGQSLAYACRIHGVRCVMVVPAVNNPDKLAAMRALGAELIEHGRDYDEARAHCESIYQEQGLRYVHSANEPDLIAGVGTYALEIFDDLPDPDVILVPVGLGSGICGAAVVAAERRPQARVIGVQSELAPAVTLSWREGRVVETGPPQTFAEGMATRMPAALTLDMMRLLRSRHGPGERRRAASDHPPAATVDAQPGRRGWSGGHGRGAAACATAWRARRWWASFPGVILMCGS